MKRKDPLQLFKFRFSKLSCICNFFLSLLISNVTTLIQHIFSKVFFLGSTVLICFDSGDFKGDYSKQKSISPTNKGRSPTVSSQFFSNMAHSKDNFLK